MSEIPPTYRTPHGLSEELRAGVLAQARGTLATIQPDGTPHLTLVLFGLADDTIVVPTPHTTRKVKNVRARPRASMIIPIGGGWASCSGDASVVEGPEAASLNAGVRERLLTDDGQRAIGHFLATHEDVTIRISPERWLSWSSDSMVQWIEDSGVDLAETPPSTWWRDLGS